MLEIIKKRVCEANIKLTSSRLVIMTWGNVSEIDRESGLVVITHSGIPYDQMTPNDMVVIDLQNGKVVEGIYKPSTDAPTHLELYKYFPEIRSITHTHSVNAVAFAQAGIDIPVLGTTHSDYFYGPVPCTRELTKNEVEKDYETNTGKVIIEEIKRRRYQIMSVPSILVKSHGAFSWGRDANESVDNSIVLEKIAEMSIKTLFLNKKAKTQSYIIEKHYKRKHGSDAYYGQKKSF